MLVVDRELWDDDYRIIPTFDHVGRLRCFRIRDDGTTKVDDLEAENARLRQEKAELADALQDALEQNDEKARAALNKMEE